MSNEDETNILLIVKKYFDKPEYNNITFEIENNLYLQLTKDCKECIGELLDVFFDEKKTRQYFKKNDDTVIYISERSIINQNKKFLALGYISFILEMIYFYIIHSKIESIKGTGTTIIKNRIEPNTESDRIKNNLNSCFNNSTVITPRIYTDNVLTHFTVGAGFMGYINYFSNYLNDLFYQFCNRLVISLQNKYNGVQPNLIVDCFYSKDNSKYDPTNPSNNYNLLYDNWIDRLIILITNNSNDTTIINNTKNDIELDIYNQISLFVNSYSYIADGVGFFSLQYLLNNMDRKSGSCITYTYLEHYILLRLFFEPSRVKLIIQCQDCLTSHIYHNVWTYTQNGIYDSLLDYRKTKGISHWFTNVNDAAFYKLKDIKIMQETDPTTGKKSIKRRDLNNIKNLVNNNKISGKIFREIPDFIQNPVLKPVSTINDIENYFRLFIYPILDSSVFYTTINYSNFTRRGVILISKFSGEIFNLIENRINVFKSANRNIPTNMIIRSLENLYDTTYDIAGDTTRQDLRDNIDIINTFNVDDIVKHFENGADKLFSFEKTNDSKLYFDRDENEEIDETDTFLKDNMTKFVNNHFYNDDNITYNFFNLINTIMTNGINNFIKNFNLPKDSIIFLFKGGNMMRYIVDTELQSNFTGKQIFAILDKKRDIFKKSDSDFQIYVKNLIGETIDGIQINKKSMDEIYENVNKLTYLLLNRIRNIILLYPNNYINFMKYSEYEKTKALDELLENLNNSKEKAESDKYKDVIFSEIRFENITAGNADITNFPYILSDQKEFNTIFTYHNKNSRGDMLIFKRSQQPDEPVIPIGSNRIAISTQKYIYDNVKYEDLLDKSIEKELIYKYKNDSNFYISYNDTLKFHRGIVYIEFNLLRMKINFSLTYKKTHSDNKIYTHLINIPGEYIDVSIPHYTSQDTTYIFQHIADKEPPIVSYDIDIPNKPQFKINSYSYNYFISDLETVLFYQNCPPWLDKKYSKRLKRLLFLYSVELLKTITVQNQSKYLELIRSIKSKLKTLIDNLKDSHIIGKTNLYLKKFEEEIQTIIVDKNDIKLLYFKFLRVTLTSSLAESDNDFIWKSKYDNEIELKCLNYQIMDYYFDNIKRTDVEKINNFNKELLNFYTEIDYINSTLEFLIDVFFKSREMIIEKRINSLKGGKKHKSKSKYNNF